MKEEGNKTGLTLAGALVAAVAASLCCILPLIAVLLGATGFAASAVIEHWRPYLLAITLGLLAVGFYLAYRPRRGACESGSVCARTPLGRWNRAILWLATAIIIVVAAFPYYSGSIARAVTKNKQPTLAVPESSAAHVTLMVEGMDCGACAALLEKNLSQIPGVHKAQVSFEKKQASVDYDSRLVGPARFAKAITDAGYRVGSLTQAGN